MRKQGPVTKMSQNCYKMGTFLVQNYKKLFESQKIKQKRLPGTYIWVCVLWNPYFLK